MTKEFFYGSRPGPDGEALKSGFRKCIELAAASGHNDMTLAVATKGNLDGVISDVLGEHFTAAMERDNQVDVRGLLVVHLATERIALRNTGPVLAAWTNIEHAKSLAMSFHATALVYLPWLDEELEGFKQAYPDAVLLP